MRVADDGQVSSLRLTDLPVEIAQHLPIPERAGGGEALTKARCGEPAYFLDEACSPHRVHARGNPSVERRPVDSDADLHDIREPVAVLGQHGGERSTGQLDDLQCTDDPTGVAWKDARCGQRVGIAQTLVESLCTLSDELVLQPRSHRRIGSWELEVVDNGSDVQGRIRRPRSG